MKIKPNWRTRYNIGIERFLPWQAVFLKVQCLRNSRKQAIVRAENSQKIEFVKLLNVRGYRYYSNAVMTWYRYRFCAAVYRWRAISASKSCCFLDSELWRAADEFEVSCTIGDNHFFLFQLFVYFFQCDDNVQDVDIRIRIFQKVSSVTEGVAPRAKFGILLETYHTAKPNSTKAAIRWQSLSLKFIGLDAPDLN
jgi:hypothetical protein